VTKSQGQEIEQAPAPQIVPDPFDLASLRLNPNFIETAGVKKLLTTIPVRRPSPQDFVRVHPSPEYRDNFAMIDLKDDREEYIVRPEMLGELAGETVLKTVFTAIAAPQAAFSNRGEKHAWSIKTLQRYSQPPKSAHSVPRAIGSGALLNVLRRRADVAVLYDT
jgi:hypothetical protein